MTPPVAGKLRAAPDGGRVFRRDVLFGLNQSPKQLPCKYFYDQRGSALFEQICDLDEYYLTRCELAIMEQFAPEMGKAIAEGALLIEFGSGSSIKTRYLLESLIQPTAYVPVDISGDHLRQSARDIRRRYPDLEVLPVCADFTRSFILPYSQRTSTHTAVYFPGSTIGNFQPTQVTELLSVIVEMCGAGGGLLIGIDLKKDPAIIERAYNDSRGVTAEFNKNVLRRINRELGGNFDLHRFSHRADYNTALGRIEMLLVSDKTQVVTVAGRSFEFAKGETICTEHSHKYTVPDFAAMAAQAGLSLRREWTDDRRYFAVLHFVVDA
jgi:dimethylhistidine N-methyltransferase